MKSVKAAKTGYIIASVAAILVGIILIIFPDISTTVICIILGWIVLLMGAAKLYGYFTNDLYKLAFQFDLALGSITALLGLLMIIFPEQFAAIIIFVAAIYVLVSAFFTLQISVEAKSFGIKWWYMLLIGAILSIIIGLLLLTNPTGGALVVMQLIGIAFIINGIQNIFVAAFTIKTRD